MSTHCFITSGHRRSSLAATAFSVLGGLLIVLQLIQMNSATALASSVPPVADPPQDISFAGVSVVRVISTYEARRGVSIKATQGPSFTECSGLGAIISSWTFSSPTDENEWVLTDGNLVDSTQELSFPLESTHTTPYVDLATADLKPTAKIGLSQQNAPASILPASSTQDQTQRDQYPIQLKQFMAPQRLPASNTGSILENGTPLVNRVGELTGMSLSSGVTSVSDLADWVHKQPELKVPQPVTHMNPVHDAWKNGISNYYQGKYAAANTLFQRAAKGNALFQAPQVFEQRIANRQANAGNEGNSNQPITISFLGVNLTIPTLRNLAIPGFAVLGVLLVLVVVLLIRARTRRRRVFQEYDEAERRAELEAQRIAAMESTQNPQRSARPAPSSPPPYSANAVTAGALAASDLRCPNCGQTVMKGDNFCSNCRMALSPSESGYHVRLMPQPPAQYSPTPALPARSLSEQPTLEMSPDASNEQPTLEIAPAVPVNGQGDAEKTVPYSIAMQQLKGNRLGFAVGTRTDPGIKRKYKPNEDSMFAAQWEQSADAEPLPFGLFVIADGMGGHANGQDASRSAIQTIIDFMLPRLSKGGIEVQNQDLEHLLAEAVQHANQVVHQHNMEQRADMGTTVTAALVVGATAYVTNVGDSRTYLYREPDGLKKVTNDHSVVASLVEARIIKPDDIYTHPKRNQIYRSLGEKATVEVDSFVVQLQPGDKLLLCSDGLWDMVRDPKIEGVVKSPVPDPRMTADALIQAALEGGGEDNVSVIVVSLTETPQHTIGHGIQLLAKPDAVQMPQL